MIREIAVDPNVVTGLDRLNAIYGEFGLDRGRLIAQFTDRSWQELVASHLRSTHSSAEMSESDLAKWQNEWKRISERLASEQMARKIWRNGRELLRAEQRAWMETALLSNSKYAFDLILSEAENRVAGPSVTKFDDRHDHHHYATQITKSVAPFAGNMVECLRPFVHMAKEWVIVDPFFWPDSRYLPFLENLLRRIAHRAPARFEIHTNGVYRSADRRFGLTGADYVSEFRKGVLEAASRLPKNIAMDLVIYDNLHDRFVLTDIGGVQSGDGFGEAASASVSKTFSILDLDHARKLYLAHTSGPRRAQARIQRLLGP